MSNIRFQESNGKLTLSLSKNDPKWGTLNDQIKDLTKGTWNESQSCWDIPKSDINIVKNILNRVTDDVNDDSSGDEGYTTDDGGADDVLSATLPPPRVTTSRTSKTSRTSRTSRDGAATNDDYDNNITLDDDEIPIVKSRGESRESERGGRAESHDHERAASRDRSRCNASRASRTSALSEDNVFDYITDDSRHHKLKKILKIRGFLYYLKCNLPKNEFRYLLRVGDITD